MHYCPCVAVKVGSAILASEFSLIMASVTPSPALTSFSRTSAAHLRQYWANLWICSTTAANSAPTLSSIRLCM